MLSIIRSASLSILAALIAAACSAADQSTSSDTTTDSSTDFDTSDSNNWTDIHSDTESAVDTDPDSDPATQTFLFASSTEIFSNPERGFYAATDITSETSYDWLTDQGFTLAMSYIRLDDFRDRDLDQAFLDLADQSLANLRGSGLKVILRFAYNFGPGDPDAAPDADKARVLRHIDQLAPIIANNADVIAVLQAGFIGAWGEWHSSTNGLDNPTDKAEILAAELEALPLDRAVQVRTPLDVQNIYGDASLNDSTAFDGSNQSRTGVHNDCFLASDDDWGTYPWGEDVEVWKDYLAANTLYTPMGGETCNVNPPRSECPTALAEMEQLHFTYINDGYEPDVVASWSTDGCRDEMEMRLGYRLVLIDATVPISPVPGDDMAVFIRLKNEGFAAPINPRPVQLILDGPELIVITADDVDVRRWLPGETAQIIFSAAIPSTLPNGEYTLSLGLPDAAEALADDPRYAIRLANENVWNEIDGTNTLGTIEINAE